MVRLEHEHGLMPFRGRGPDGVGSKVGAGASGALGASTSANGGASASGSATCNSGTLTSDSTSVSSTEGASWEESATRPSVSVSSNPAPPGTMAAMPKLATTTPPRTMNIRSQRIRFFLPFCMLCKLRNTWPVHPHMGTGSSTPHCAIHAARFSPP